jgi:tetratricopeptide (TPR) repeat protein
LFVLVVVLLFAPAVDPSVLLKKGLLELQQGRLREARADLLEASKSDPRNGYVWSALAEVYLRNHEPVLAASAAARAEKYSQDNPLLSHALALYYSRAGEYAKAAADERRYAESQASDPASNTRVARWYLAAGDIQAAVPFAEKAAASDEPTGFELAQILLKQQRFTEAAEVLEAGLDTHRGDAQLTLALGVARYGQRRFEEAIERFLDVIRTDPTVEQPYRFLGRMLDQAGSHLDEIIADAEAWSNQNPEDGDAKVLLAKALLARNPDDKRTEVLLQRGVQLQPDNWEAHYQLGILLESKHQYEAAAEQLTKAVELNGREPMPHYHLSRVYNRLGKTGLAEAELKRHLELTGGVSADRR